MTYDSPNFPSNEVDDVDSQAIRPFLGGRGKGELRDKAFDYL